MKHPYTPYYPCSLLSLSSLMILIVFLQGSVHAVAQSNQQESVFGSNNKIRPSSTTSLSLNNDDTAGDVDENIYDDDNNEGFEEISSTTKSSLQVKVTSKVTSSFPAHAEELQKEEYGDESESYPNDLNDDDTTNPDESQVFPDTIPIKSNDIKTEINTFDNKKIPDYSTTSRPPFLTANLWRDLFTKPGILVGIIGGVVIGMLSAILLVMFIIYRMRKKDEGSYALEEGPRKSPSHAYTRVSSREFFA